MKVLRATPELIAKLPKWAFEYIKGLEREVQLRKQAVHEMAYGDSDNDFSYTFTLDTDLDCKRFALPKWSSLSVFAGPRGDRLDSPNVLDLSATTKHGNSQSEKMLYVSTPRGALEVIPACANAVYIRNRDW